MEAEGGVRLAVAGTEYNFGPLQAVIALVLLALALWLLFKLAGFLGALLRFINGDDTALTRHFGRRRERRGYDALADGMMALASGEGKVAMEKGAKAERYLRRPELTNLMIAQGAEMAGDRRRAEESYRQLVTNERTRFVGIRGLLQQRLAMGDTDTALKLAEKAYAIRPKHEGTQDTLLKLQTQRGDWSAARKTLEGKLRTGTMPRDLHRRRDAVLALSEASGAFSTASDAQAQQAAIEANKLSPGLVPAAVAAARAYVAQGKTKYATRALRKAWETQPHPDLAAAFAEIQPAETPAERIKRFRALTEVKPDHAETRMLNAELALAAEDFPAARRALGDLPTEHPTARALTLMAAVERGEGSDDSVVRAWLARAVAAPRGPQWVCDNCSNIQGEWAPVCDNCGAFDTLSWTEPPRAETPLPGGTGTLPLLAGQSDLPEPRDEEPPTDETRMIVVEDAPPRS
jgi:HemY protein